MPNLWYVQGAVGQKLQVFTLCQPGSILQPLYGDRRLPMSLAVQDSRVLWQHGNITGLCDEGQLTETWNTWRKRTPSLAKSVQSGLCFWGTKALQQQASCSLPYINIYSHCWKTKNTQNYVYHEHKLVCSCKINIQMKKQKRFSKL